MSEMDLWGNATDVFVSAREKYGIWPTSVWPLDFSDQLHQNMKKVIGDTDAREGVLQSSVNLENTKSTYKVSTSAFSPVLASYILNCFAPQEGTVFDPFAGGGTRAIMCAKRGLKYVGCEIRQAEVENVLQKCVKFGVLDLVTILEHDSRYPTHLEDRSADFTITCPPYYNLEKYRGPYGDLSMLPTYAVFVEELGKSIAETRRVLKRGALSCWVTGMHRDDSGLLTMHHDVTALHKKHGFTLREEVVINNQNNGAITRVGMFEKGEKYLVRMHEYLSVFERT